MRLPYLNEFGQFDHIYAKFVAFYLIRWMSFGRISHEAVFYTKLNKFANSHTFYLAILATIIADYVALTIFGKLVPLSLFKKKKKK